MADGLCIFMNFQYLHSNDNTEDMSFYMETASVSLADLIMPENPEKQAVEDIGNDELLDGIPAEKVSETKISLSVLIF